jgi:hypothetical protein
MEVEQEGKGEEKEAEAGRGKDKEKDKEKEKEVALRWRRLCGDEVVTSAEGLLKEWEARVGVQTGLTNEGPGRDRLVAQYLLPGGKSRRIAAFVEDGHAPVAGTGAAAGPSILPHMHQTTNVLATLLLAAFPRLEGGEEGEEDELSRMYRPKQVVVVPGDTEVEGKGEEEEGGKKGRGKKRKTEEEEEVVVVEVVKGTDAKESPAKKGAGRKRKSVDPPAPTPVPAPRPTRRTRQSQKEEDGEGKEAAPTDTTEKEGEGKGEASSSSAPAPASEEGKAEEEKEEEEEVVVYDPCPPVLLRVDRLCMRRGRSSLPKLLTIITTVTKAALAIESITCLDWGVDVPYPVKTVDTDPSLTEKGKEDGHREVAVVLEALGLEREEVLGKARYRMQGRQVMERCSKATHLTSTLAAAAKPTQAGGSKPQGEGRAQGEKEAKVADKSQAAADKMVGGDKAAGGDKAVGREKGASPDKAAVASPEKKAVGGDKTTGGDKAVATPEKKAALTSPDKKAVGGEKAVASPEKKAAAKSPPAKQTIAKQRANGRKRDAAAALEELEVAAKVSKTKA